MLLSGLAATGTVAVNAVLVDQLLVDQNAVIPGGNPEIVKFTPAASLNEPNAS